MPTWCRGSGWPPRACFFLKMKKMCEFVGGERANPRPEHSPVHVLMQGQIRGVTAVWSHEESLSKRVTVRAQQPTTTRTAR